MPSTDTVASFTDTLAILSVSIEGATVSHVENLTGQKFGILTVVQRAEENTAAGKTRWLCFCECGNHTTRVGASLLNGRKRSVEMSCGCLKGEVARNNGKRSYKNKVGNVYGHLTVVNPIPSLGGEILWECLCDCGGTVTLSSKQLVPSSGRKICNNHIYTDIYRHPGWRGYKGISMTIWNKIVRGAEIRNLEFSISIQEAWDLFVIQDMKCALTGWSIDFSKSWKDTSGTTASLDRVDSGRGYTLDNVQWVYKDINQLKWCWPQDKFISLCKAVAAHNA